MRHFAAFNFYNSLNINNIHFTLNFEQRLKDAEAVDGGASVGFAGAED